MVVSDPSNFSLVASYGVNTVRTYTHLPYQGQVMPTASCLSHGLCAFDVGTVWEMIHSHRDRNHPQ